MRFFPPVINYILHTIHLADTEFPLTSFVPNQRTKKKHLPSHDHFHYHFTYLYISFRSKAFCVPSSFFFFFLFYVPKVGDGSFNQRAIRYSNAAIYCLFVQTINGDGEDDGKDDDNVEEKNNI